jgi:BolA protein
VTATGAAVDTEDVKEVIQQRLACLAPFRLELIDESARHAGHAGAKDGGGHYRLLVVSPVFAGQTRLARHRLVHAALGDLMHRQIHALSIQALTPSETSSTALTAG